MSSLEQFPATPSALPPGQQLSRNPMLPQHPLGAYTDAQYEAQAAQLRNQIAKQYADVLSQLGYTDDAGNFIKGSVETDADRQRFDLNRSMGLAQDEVTRAAQQQGTLFSGRRAENQARAEYPFAQGLSRLATDVPLALQRLYEQAGGLVNDYTLGMNNLLADAATRRAAGIVAAPGGGAGAAPAPAGAPDLGANGVLPPAGAEIVQPAPNPAQHGIGFGSVGVQPPPQEFTGGIGGVGSPIHPLLAGAPPQPAPLAPNTITQLAAQRAGRQAFGNF